MNFQIITKKNNLGKLKSLAKNLSKQTVQYGYFEEQGVHASGLPYATLMAIHEYGTGDGHIPARKPFSIALFLNQEKLFKFTLNSLGKHIMSANKSLPLPLEHTLATFGAYGVKYTKAVFGSSHLLPNKAPVRKRSGVDSNTPLVDFGELREKVTYKITRR